LWSAACGGGGGGGGSSSGTGSDGGGVTPRPSSSPLPVQSPTASPAIVKAGDSIAAAARKAAAGSTVVITPGTYTRVSLEPGAVQDSVTRLADVSGVVSESAPAPITVDAQGGTAAFSISGATNLTVDGFTLRGGTTTGVTVLDSSGITIRDCTVKRNTGDG